MRILGVSAFYHDSAAAVVIDGQIVAAAQEERFTRRKHDDRFPGHATRACLAQTRLSPDDIDLVVFYEKPFLKFERLIDTYLAFAPRGYTSFSAALPVWIQDKLFQKARLRDSLTRLGFTGRLDERLLFAEHHQSHAASAFFPSPFSEAVVLTMDGVGEWATTSVSIGRGRALEPVREIQFPHSLGLLYSAFTYYTGFRVNSGEYKVMGLAPYGTPRFARLILDNVIDVKSDGTFRLNLDYFDYCTGLRMTNERLDRLFGRSVRRPDEPLEQFHMDVAASIQAVTDEVVLTLTRALAAEFNIPNLCLAGGVALNCVSNGKVLRDGAFKRMWIQPAAGDAGGAVGAALAAYHLHAGHDRVAHAGSDGMSGSYLGPSFSHPEIEARLRAVGATFETVADDDAMTAATADALARDETVGWFQGRMEFGPRALGARSILGNPLSPSTQKVLNLKVKFRESFRPFAPSVLREDAADWFELDVDSPYMLLVADVRRERRRQMSDSEERLFGIDKLNVVRSDIPAVTHVDYSARIQTVDSVSHPLYYQLLQAFKARTGCPVLVNTSFNVRGEPIVCTPEDAFRCFMGTDLDVLVAGRCILRKTQQDASLARSYESAFVPD
ncbi:MAG: carbamoyltransferase [Acidobacteria bacterium]|nr:carbamoyltransferase [Acidobacteriota bacterium]